MKTCNNTKHLNYELYESDSIGYKLLKSKLIKLFNFLLKELPKEDIIEELKKRKIIQRDWLENGTKHKLKELDRK